MGLPKGPLRFGRVIRRGRAWGRGARDLPSGGCGVGEELGIWCVCLCVCLCVRAREFVSVIVRLACRRVVLLGERGGSKVRAARWCACARVRVRSTARAAPGGLRGCAFRAQKIKSIRILGDGFSRPTRRSRRFRNTGAGGHGAGSERRGLDGAHVLVVAFYAENGYPFLGSGGKGQKATPRPKWVKALNVLLQRPFSPSFLAPAPKVDRVGRSICLPRDGQFICCRPVNLFAAGFRIRAHRIAPLGPRRHEAIRRTSSLVGRHSRTRARKKLVGRHSPTRARKNALARTPCSYNPISAEGKASVRAAAGDRANALLI